MKLYNTLSKKVEEFVPADKQNVKMFACGPTVYDYLHIGNGRTAITMDILARVLRKSDYKVNFLINITDIDDKIINRSKELNLDWKELTQKYENQYKIDMKNLDVKIDQYARATDHINDIINQVETLIKKDFAYKTSDGIYFEIAKFKDYGKLSGRKDVQKDDAQSRIDESDEKRGWNDFALWKFEKPGEPSWPAPFGDGRPGWHIEDTAITEHFFGPQYDIHGGGSDLIFPHHEAEITQMEAASGLVPFVRYWVHGGLLYIDDKRMGKSNNNFITIKNATEKYSASEIRLLFLQGHYRSQINYSEELMESACSRLKRWQRVADLRWQISSKPGDISSDIINLNNKILEHMQNDLDSPSAISEFEKIIDLIEKFGVNEKSIGEFNNAIEDLYDLMGINLVLLDIDDETKSLINQRQDARKNKDYQLSDKLRNDLLSKGIELNDHNETTTWSRV